MNATQAHTHNEQLPDSPYALLCHYADVFATEQHVEHEQDFDKISYLGFSVGEQHFLLRISDVRSVLNELQYLTRLPFSPPWLLGLSSVRGEIVSVVALAQALGRPLSKSASSNETHYILLGGEAEGFLLKVDRLHGINRAEVDETAIPKNLPFVDGQASFEGGHWQRINLSMLLRTALSE